MKDIKKKDGGKKIRRAVMMHRALGDDIFDENYLSELKEDYNFDKNYNLNTNLHEVADRVYDEIVHSDTHPTSQDDKEILGELVKDTDKLMSTLNQLPYQINVNMALLHSVDCLYKFGEIECTYYMVKGNPSRKDVNLAKESYHIIFSYDVGEWYLYAHTALGDFIFKKKIECECFESINNIFCNYKNKTKIFKIYSSHHIYHLRQICLRHGGENLKVFMKVLPFSKELSKRIDIIEKDIVHNNDGLDMFLLYEHNPGTWSFLGKNLHNKIVTEEIPNYFDGNNKSHAHHIYDYVTNNLYGSSFDKKNRLLNDCKANVEMLHRVSDHALEYFARPSKLGRPKKDWLKILVDGLLRVYYDGSSNEFKIGQNQINEPSKVFSGALVEFVFNVTKHIVKYISNHIERHSEYKIGKLPSFENTDKAGEYVRKHEFYMKYSKKSLKILS